MENSKLALTITRENFQQEVAQSNIPVVLGFWTTWCSPCQVLIPKMEKIAQEMQGTVKFGLVNADMEPEVVEDCHVMSLPTIVLWKNGVVISEVYGVNSREKLRKLIRSRFK